MSAEVHYVDTVAEMRRAENERLEAQLAWERAENRKLREELADALNRLARLRAGGNG